jgi:hypothetical protein
VSSTLREHLPLELNDEAPLKSASDTNAPMNPEQNFFPLREAAFAAFLPFATVPSEGRQTDSRSVNAFLEDNSTKYIAKLP